MQRKNNILKPSKNAFAMIMAIIVVIVIGGLMAFSLSLVAQTGKRTTDLYLYEQTVLYSKSAAELALLDIAKHNPCTQVDNNYTLGTIYNANVKMSYVYTTPSPCASATNDYFTVTTAEQNGSVLMDITVTTNEGTEPIRYFRRVMQKL